MHIAFEAARLLESEPSLALGEQDTLTEPFVDENDQPYVVISVESSAMDQTARRLPLNVTVLDQTVLIILKPASMGMGLH